MATTLIIELSVQEVCQSVGISEEVLSEIVAQGIIEPAGESPAHWVFDARVVGTARKAVRLHRELEIDWAGIAVALELLDELDQLRTENQTLRRRLSRFLRD